MAPEPVHEPRDFCGEHSRCMEKFQSLETWRDEMKIAFSGMSERVTELRIFRAQIVVVVAVCQVIGAVIGSVILQLWGR